MFVISLGQGIKVDSGKVEAIKLLEAPTSVKGVRSFLGFANFYPRFGNIAYPLLNLTKKKKYLWLDEHEKSFNHLEKLFVSAPILTLYDPDNETVVQADCSGYAMGACLSQIDKTKTMSPVMYFSRKLAPAECNYEIYDKELLATISALKEWRGELIGL